MTKGTPIVERNSLASSTVELLLFVASIINKTISESDARFTALVPVRSDGPSKIIKSVWLESNSVRARSPSTRNVSNKAFGDSPLVWISNRYQAEIGDRGTAYGRWTYDALS